MLLVQAAVCIAGDVYSMQLCGTGKDLHFSKETAPYWLRHIGLVHTASKANPKKGKAKQRAWHTPLPFLGGAAATGASTGSGSGAGSS